MPCEGCSASHHGPRGLCPPCSWHRVWHLLHEPELAAAASEHRLQRWAWELLDGLLSAESPCGVASSASCSDPSCCQV